MSLNLYFLIKKFLDNLNYQLNNDELKLQLLSHPSYPSLHSVTGLLNHFSIENLALEVPKDFETLQELPEIFLSITTGQQYILVHKFEDHIHILFDNKEKKKVTKQEFLNLWSGFIVAIEENESAQTSNTAIFSLQPILYGISGVLLLSLFFINSPTLFISLHFILATIGLGFSYFIVQHELGFRSKAIDKICSAIESTSCDAVLNSDGASLSKNVKLSDACLVYFTSVTLYWILSQLYSVSQSIIIVPTVLAIPATIYSIYYQARVVKKWCPLCLGITVILWLQFFSLLTYNGFPYIDLELIDGIVLFTSILLVSAIWSFTKPLLVKSFELGKLRVSHYKFIRNFDLFKAAIGNSESIDPIISGVQDAEIILGNKNAPLQLLLITNPECHYCKEAHTNLEKILDKYIQDVCATIRFSVDFRNENLGFKVSQRLLELYNSHKMDMLNTAMHEAYSKNIDLKKWIEKWGETKSTLYSNLLKKQRNWCLEKKINFTPTLYVNGKAFPREYEREHLFYFIEDLTELFSSVPNGVELLIADK